MINGSKRLTHHSDKRERSGWQGETRQPHRILVGRALLTLAGFDWCMWIYWMVWDINPASASLLAGYAD